MPSCSTTSIPTADRWCRSSSRTSAVRGRPNRESVVPSAVSFVRASSSFASRMAGGERPEGAVRIPEVFEQRVAQNEIEGLPREEGRRLLEGSLDEAGRNRRRGGGGAGRVP